MSGSFEFTPGGEVVIEKDGRVVLDTSLNLLNLIPDEAIVLAAYDIVFPDLWHGVIYHQTRVSSGPPLNIDSYGCASFNGLVAQEWGPAEASPNTLADATLGTVPTGTDYLEVFVRLARTVTPPGWLDLGMRSDIPASEWVLLQGGSCLVEEIPGMRRLFEVLLDGTTVKLRRKQSVTVNGQVGRSYPFGTGNAIGYFAGTNAPAGSVLLASYGSLLQIKGPSGASNHRPPGSAISQDPCTTTPTSYASTWTGDIVIKPGRIGA